MDVAITTKNENPYLFRTEVRGTLAFTGATPSHAQLKEALAKHLKVAEQTVAITHIYTKFGTPEATFTAHVYQTAEQLQNIEPKPKEKVKKEGAPAK